MESASKEVPQVANEEKSVLKKKTSGRDMFILVSLGILVFLATIVLCLVIGSSTVTATINYASGAHIRAQTKCLSKRVVSFTFVIAQPGDYLLYYEECPKEGGPRGYISYLQLRPDRTFIVSKVQAGTITYKGKAIQVPMLSHTGHLRPTITIQLNEKQLDCWCGKAFIRKEVSPEVLTDKTGTGLV